MLLLGTVLLASTLAYAGSVSHDKERLPSDGMLVADLAADLQNAVMGALKGKAPAPTVPAQPGQAGTRSGNMTNYGGKDRLPGESVADCNTRLGGGTRDSNGLRQAESKGVREQCGYTGYDGVY